MKEERDEQGGGEGVEQERGDVADCGAGIERPTSPLWRKTHYPKSLPKSSQKKNFFKKFFSLLISKKRFPFSFQREIRIHKLNSRTCKLKLSFDFDQTGPFFFCFLICVFEVSVVVKFRVLSDITYHIISYHMVLPTTPLPISCPCNILLLPRSYSNITSSSIISPNTFFYALISSNHS